MNSEKTRVMERGGPQRVTGVTVNEVLGLSRKKRRRIRAMIHDASKNGADQKRLAELNGLLSWVHMLNPEQAAALRKKAKF